MQKTQFSRSRVRFEWGVLRIVNMAVANNADLQETYLDEDYDADFDFEGFHLDEIERTTANYDRFISEMSFPMPSIDKEIEIDDHIFEADYAIYETNFKPSL